ncbi:SWIM zinc finger family protein [Psychrobacillus sp. L4]|uniref:SWIM zinc finger family protein n=1 Tax=Psychrobacillus sp. L4 TaxID=3236892 RepID=UPI0036F43F70
MNINTFENQFHKTILKRGYDYYIDGHVEDIVQIDAHNWQAEVDGTSIYVVDVRIHANGDILYADCDCPYDGDCKHIVAVLYEIRDQQQTAQIQLSSPLKKKNKPTFQQLLQSQTKEQLVVLLTKVGKNHPAFMKELEMLLIKPDDSLKAAEQVILHHIDIAQDRRSSFIPWNQTSKALKGIETIHEQIGEHIENNKYLLAVQLSLLCFHHAFEAFQHSDDSSGDFGYSLDESLAFMEQAILEGVDVWDKEQYETVYELIMQEAINTELDGWSEYRIPLIQTCIPLCQDDTIEKKYVDFLQSLVRKGDNWSTEYMNRQLKDLHFKLIASKYSKEDVEKFLEQNIEDASMRERVILSAIERNDYTKVLQLSQEGQRLDHDSPGIVNKWKHYTFTAYKELDSKDEMYELALQLVREGDYNYYGEFKSLHTTQQWPAALEQLLDALKKARSRLYAKLIVEEQQTERILDYCKEYPALIEQYYHYIKEQYYEEVCSLFINIIRASAARASDRKRYQEVCRTIETMQDASYELEAKQLIIDLLQTYPKRRAFVDELGKLQRRV